MIAHLSNLEEMVATQGESVSNIHNKTKTLYKAISFLILTLRRIMRNEKS